MENLFGRVSEKSVAIFIGASVLTAEILKLTSLEHPWLTVSALLTGLAVAGLLARKESQGKKDGLWTKK